MRLTLRGITLALLALALPFTVAGDDGEPKKNDVRTIATKMLPILGHRNWIGIVDSAYPAQSRPGILSLTTGSDHLEAIRTVLDLVDKSKHVRANVYLDAELPYVAAADAPGIGEFRRELKSLLGRRKVQSVPHEKIIARLDAVASQFTVLMLKTEGTLPYTSVFLELDCGYWNEAAEKRLREAMKAKGGEDK